MAPMAEEGESNKCRRTVDTATQIANCVDMLKGELNITCGLLIRQMSSICMRKLVTEELMSACVKVQKPESSKRENLFPWGLQVAGAEGQDINALLGDDTVVRDFRCQRLRLLMLSIRADEQRGGVQGGTRCVLNRRGANCATPRAQCEAGCGCDGRGQRVD
jgi:hypothetical protein